MWLRPRGATLFTQRKPWDWPVFSIQDKNG
jgi:hypothetical protein